MVLGRSGELSHIYSMCNDVILVIRPLNIEFKQNIASAVSGLMAR